MSFGNLVVTASTVIAVVTGITIFVTFLEKNYKNKAVMLRIPVVALTTFAFLFAIFAASTFAIQPQIVINHVTGIPLPGHPVPTESNSNTVVVVTQPPTPTNTTKTYDENRTLTCIALCNSGLTVKLTSVVINITQQNMTWNFTIANNSQYGCSGMNVSLYVEDPAGKQTQASAPGTLTESTPLGTGQTVQEYTTIALIPQHNVTYSLHASPNCSLDNYGDTDQIETFQFN